MSDFGVISAVSTGIKQLLQDHLSLQLPKDKPPVELGSPPEVTVTGAGMKVSLWLYRVVRDEFMLNRPPERPAANQVARYPLPIDLHYLVTPVAKAPESRQMLLGAVLQVFNDHSILAASDLGVPSPVQGAKLRMNLETLTLEQLSQAWYALKEPYQLSVSYLLQLVSIDSGHEPLLTPPVLERIDDYKQIVGVR